MSTFPDVRSIRLLVLVLLLLGPAACASGGGGGGGNSDLLTAEDLRGVTANSLLDAIQRARPAWLRLRGGSTVGGPDPVEVYVDGIQMPDRIDALRRVRVEDVLDARRLSSSDATTRFGTGHGSGAIVVRTR